MILDNLITKKELKKRLQSEYDNALYESNEAKKKGYTHTHTFYNGVVIACLRIAEDFGIKLDTKEKS